jgi:magnesium chelatase family protein
MSLAIVYSRASFGIDAPLITIEIHISNGMPSMSIVGLPETAVKESRDRVRSALLNAGFEFPCRRITINLAPADLPKQGSRFDLAIALGVLAASQQIPANALLNYEFAAELALDGHLRPINGVLPFAIATRQAKRKLLISANNAEQLNLVSDIDIYPATHLLEVCAHICQRDPISRFQPSFQKPQSDDYLDLADVQGQYQAKRCLEIAAAGRHSLLICGPPGTGKTMLANRLPGILPPLSEEEALEIAAIHSLYEQSFQPEIFWKRHFRSPHHTASSAAIIGGGRPPKPGEISLSHQGVLFLDEFPEFHRSVIEALREPLESGQVTVSRAGYQLQWPAKFQLIAAMNPCPCGYYGDFQINCRCTPEKILRYKNKISGPILDRIDLHLAMPRPKTKDFLNPEQSSETSFAIRKRVLAARQIQIQRRGKVNSELSPAEISNDCKLSEEISIFVGKIMDIQQLSSRRYQRILQVARTIADLRGEISINRDDISEALLFQLKS